MTGLESLWMLRRETFPEIGRPRHAVQVGNAMVVAGRVSRDEAVSEKLLEQYASLERVAAYDLRTRECRHAFSSSHTVNAMAAQPGGDLVAIGTGEYDGGFAWWGKLLLFNVVNGDVISLLSERREVREVLWVGGGTLEATLMPATEDSQPFVVDRICLDSAVWHNAQPSSIDPSGFVVSTSPCELEGTAEPS